MSCEAFLGAGQAKSLGGLDRDWPRDSHVPYPCHFRDRVSLALCLSMPWPTSPKKSKCPANFRTQGNADQKQNKNQRNANQHRDCDARSGPLHSSVLLCVRLLDARRRPAEFLSSKLGRELEWKSVRGRPGRARPRREDAKDAARSAVL